MDEGWLIISPVCCGHLVKVPIALMGYLASQGILVKMVKTIEPHGIF